MRPTFGREYIENEFQRIGDALSAPLTVYLIGGGASQFLAPYFRSCGNNAALRRV
jgi:DNA-binding MurR/RpiR family transcriptional regulator